MAEPAEISLVDRIQNRLNHGSSVPTLSALDITSDPGNNDSSSGTDIDDNITVEECATLMKRRKLEKASDFTKVRLKTPLLRPERIVAESGISYETETIQQNKHSAQNENNCDHWNNIEKSHLNPVLNNNSGISMERNNAASVQHKCQLTNINKVVSYPVTSTSGSDSTAPLGHLHQNDHVSYLSNQVDKVFVPVKKKRVQLTDEERKVAKEQKEREKLEKKKKCDEIKLEKERKIALKKVNTLNNRSERKDECMERVLTVIDPCLIEESGGADILKSLQEMNIRYEIKRLPVLSCIGWMRKNIGYQLNENSEINKSTNYVEEAHVIYKMTASELAIRINAHINKLKEVEVLSNLAAKLKQSYPEKKITVVITGLNAYYRFVKTEQNQQFQNQALNIDQNQQVTKRRGKKSNNVPLLTKKQIDDNLANLQIMTDLSLRFCEDSAQFSSFVVSFTKSIAEAPFKKISASSLNFCVAAPSDKLSVKISNDGHGVLQLWNQQLQQFYGVRHDTSVAITQVYRTPLALIQAYRSSEPSQGVNLLQDIEVRRGVGALQTQRRIGPELSKRIYKLLTSKDGDEHLAK